MNVLANHPVFNYWKDLCILMWWEALRVVYLLLINHFLLGKDISISLLKKVRCFERSLKMCFILKNSSGGITVRREFPLLLPLYRPFGMITTTTPFVLETKNVHIGLSRAFQLSITEDSAIRIVLHFAEVVHFTHTIR